MTAEEQIERVLDGLREVLDDDLVAVYLLGSAVSGVGARRLPEQRRARLARAPAIYVGEEDERWDDLRAAGRVYAEHVVQQIEGVAGGARSRGA